MTNPHQELINVLNLARATAAQDLELSNTLLDIAAKLMQHAEQNQPNPDELAKLAQEIVDAAMKLTEQSRRMSSSVSRLVGA